MRTPCFHSPAAVRDLARQSKEGLKEWFQQLLLDTTSDPDPALELFDMPDPSKVVRLDPAYVAMVLRESVVSLTDLGVIAPDAAKPSKKHPKNWVRLEVCLSHAQPEDGLVIFKAMAAALKKKCLFTSMDVMKRVLESVSWRGQAIEAVPGFFTKNRTQRVDHLQTAAVMNSCNAFQVLAALSSEDVPGADFANTMEIIDALHKAGARDFPHPNTGLRALHLAAYGCAPEVLRAFAQAFHSDLEMLNNFDMTALDNAAISDDAKRVQVLLQAGANPHPFKSKLQRRDSSPLWKAALKERFDNVQVLLESGAYSDEDVEQIHEAVKDQHVIDRVLACHAAIKASRVLAGTGTDHHEHIRPL